MHVAPWVSLILRSRSNEALVNTECTVKTAGSDTVIGFVCVFYLHPSSLSNKHFKLVLIRILCLAHWKWREEVAILVTWCMFGKLIQWCAGKCLTIGSSSVVPTCMSDDIFVYVIE